MQRQAPEGAEPTGTGNASANTAGQTAQPEQPQQAEQPEQPEQPEQAEQPQQPLPEKVRQRVVELASDRLGTMSAAEVPAPLRRVARFEPRRRHKLAATQIAAHVEADGEFREQVADHVRQQQPRLAEGLENGSVPAAADPVAVAAGAYLLRPDGWARQVDLARDVLSQEEAAAQQTADAEEVAHLRQQVADVRETGRSEARQLRSELREARSEIADLRRKLREARDRTHRAEQQADAQREAADQERANASQAAASADAELRKLRGRVGDAEAAAEAARRSARESRSAEDARLHVLLDSLVDAAQGLRRELALPATISRPADALDATESHAPGAQDVPGRGLAEDDPALLDHLLALPQLHLVIDGYNVTKSGYPTLTLEAQRTRLLRGLAALAAQTRVEMTCVFDGADLSGPVPVTAPRGVRVLFSDPGETADDLICRLVRAEPPGRAVVVVSGDREIADDVRRSGARPVPSRLLLRRLERG